MDYAIFNKKQKAGFLTPSNFIWLRVCEKGNGLESYDLGRCTESLKYMYIDTKQFN